jgi:UDPglucose 6-dehydrogenase
MGRSVIAWDPDAELRELVSQGDAPVNEPGVAEALKSAIDHGLLTVEDDLGSLVQRVDTLHITFDSTVDSSGLARDDRLDQAVEVFAAKARPQSLLVVSSQVVVGTGSKWLEMLAGTQRDLRYVYVPENLRLGLALQRALNPDFVIVGGEDQRSRDAYKALLAPRVAGLLEMDVTSAELAKHAINAYLGMCISFGNEMAWLTRSAGGNVNAVSDALRADPRVADSAPVGPGGAFSGATLKRDLVALRDLGETCGRPELFAAILQVNERHSQHAFALLQDELGSLEGHRVAVLGLTYKANVSTLRDSLPLRLIKAMLDSGATVSAYDPVADPVDDAPKLERAPSLAVAVEGADAVMILSNLTELKDLQWERLSPRRRLLVDGCLAVDRGKVEKDGWQVLSISA